MENLAITNQDFEKYGFIYQHTNKDNISHFHSVKKDKEGEPLLYMMYGINENRLTLRFKRSKGFFAVVFRGMVIKTPEELDFILNRCGIEFQ